jgi:hypothetical protein
LAKGNGSGGEYVMEAEYYYNMGDWFRTGWQTRRFPKSFLSPSIRSRPCWRDLCQAVYQ